MSHVVTVRLPESTAETVRRIARKERRSVSDVGARMIEEWVRQSQFASIEFRSYNGERQACVKDRLQVWQVIEVAMAYKMDAGKTAAHLGLTAEQTQAAFHYYEVYSDEIDAEIGDNDAMGYEQVKRLLPNIRLSEVVIPTEHEAS